MPHMYVEGATLYLPQTRPLSLSQQQASVLHYCTGQHTARELAQLLIHDDDSKFSQEEEVYAVLEQLQQSRRITWALTISAKGAEPEDQLRQQLECIGDELLRDRYMTMLQRMEAARDQIALAAGYPERLDEAIERLETTFTALTAKQPTRAAGQMYLGRTLIYEDCRRESTVELGPELLQELGEPLTLLLTSARWFTYHIAMLYRRAFQKVYTQLVQKSGRSQVDFPSFSLAIQPLLLDDRRCLVRAFVPLFQERWRTLLPISEGLKRLQYSSQALRVQVQQTFEAPGPGWQAARYHNPDIFIAAPSINAIGAGQYQLVLGEFHPAMNTLHAPNFLKQHPFPKQLLHDVAVDLPEPRILPLVSHPTSHPRLSLNVFPGFRTRPALVTQKDIALVYTPESYEAPPARSLPVGALIVEEIDGKLIASTRDGQDHFDIIEVVAEILSKVTASSFSLFPARKHTPRISIDRLVVERETWRFFPQDLTFAREIGAAERFMAVRRWVKQHEIPRFIFVKVPQERKPYYIDLTSPIYIELFARLIRGSTKKQSDNTDAELHEEIKITEMLPTPEQLWLVDVQGQHYTNELRLVALDHLSVPHSFPQQRGEAL